MKSAMKLLLTIAFCVLASGLVYSQTSVRTKKNTNGVNASGKPHGRWVYYFDRENQVIQSTGKYRKGVPVGKWVLYYPEGGKDVITRYYGKRAREKRYQPNGTIEKKGWSRLVLDDPEAIRYYWDGRWRLYNEDGNFQGVVLYKNGELVKVIREN
jgi:antitoxin component YwqK of YwqJK toxin-antitoxin module